MSAVGESRPRPLISVVVPTYNSGERLDACLDSILAQSFRDFELVVIDGGSKDGTVDRLADRAKSNPALVWQSGRDGGVYDAMNKGVKLARGAWILFLGSDDELYAKDVFERVVPHLSADHDLVYGNVLSVGASAWAEDGAIYDGEFNEEKILERNICHQAIFYSKQLFATYGGYDPSFKVLADWEYNLRVFRKARKKYIDVVIARFAGGGLSTRAVDRDFLVRLPEVVGHAFGLPWKTAYYRQRLPAVAGLAFYYWRRRRFRSALRFFGICLVNADRRGVRELRRQLPLLRRGIS